MQTVTAGLRRTMQESFNGTTTTSLINVNVRHLKSQLPCMSNIFW